ncbi:hypothetical protein KEM55_000694, partial [Ascosphaera atra]
LRQATFILPRTSEPSRGPVHLNSDDEDDDDGSDYYDDRDALLPGAAQRPISRQRRSSAPHGFAASCRRLLASYAAIASAFVASETGKGLRVPAGLTGYLHRAHRVVDWDGPGYEAHSCDADGVLSSGADDWEHV